MHTFINVNDQDDFPLPFPQKCPQTLDKNSTTTILRTRQNISPRNSKKGTSSEKITGAR